MGKTYLQGEVLTAADLNASLSEAVNTTGYFVFTGEHIHNANLTSNTNFFSNSFSYFSGASTFNANSAFNANVTLNTTAILTTSNTISDRIGNVRRVPINSVASGYTLIALDSGKTISISGGTLNIPANVFAAGETITIYNSSTTAVNLSIVPAGTLTLYWAGQTALTSGTRTLSLQGLCTILFTSGTAAVITGSGLT